MQSEPGLTLQGADGGLPGAVQVEGVDKSIREAAPEATAARREAEWMGPWDQLQVIQREERPHQLPTYATPEMHGLISTRAGKTER